MLAWGAASGADGARPASIVGWYIAALCQLTRGLGLFIAVIAGLDQPRRSAGSRGRSTACCKRGFGCRRRSPASDVVLSLLLYVALLVIYS